MLGLPEGIGSIIASLGIIDVNFSEELKKADQKTRDAAKKIDTAMTAIGLAGAAAFGLMIKEAAHFETKMNEVGSLLGKSGKDQLELYKTQLLDLATKTPLALDDLTKGLYNVVSATVPMNDQMFVMEKASQAAVAGVADLESTFNLGSSIVKGFGYEFKEIDKVFDVVFQTIKDGQTDMTNLASSFGKVTGIAKSAGISFEEVSAAVAASAGVVGSTSETITMLRGSISSLLAPTGDLEKYYTSIGVKTGPEFIKTSGGIQGALAQIVKYAEETRQPLAKFIGSVEGQTIALSLAGPQAEDYAKKLGNMKEAWEKGGVAAEATEIQMASFENQMKVIRNTVQVAGIQIGNQFLPILTALASLLKNNADAIIFLIKAFAPFAGAITLIIGLNKAFGYYKKTMDAVKLAQGLLTKTMAASQLAFGAVGIAITAIVVLYQALKTASENAKKAAREEITSLGDKSKTLSEQYARYKELKSITEPTAQQQLELTNLTNDLNIKLAEENKSLENCGNSFEEYLKQADQKALEELNKKIQETESSIAELNKKQESWTTHSLKANRKIEAQTETLELMKTKQAELTDKIAAQEQAQKLLTAENIKGHDQILKHVVSLKSAIKANEGNKTITDQLTKELEKYEGQLEKVGETEKTVKSSKDLLKEAGIKLTSELNDEIKKYEKLLPLVKTGSKEYEQIKSKLAALYTEMGDTDAVIKLTTGLNASDIQLKNVGNSLGNIRSRIDNVKPQMVTLADTQKKLSDAGITTKESIEKQIEQMKELAPAVKGDDVAINDLLEKLKPLYEQLGRGDEFNEFVKNLDLSTAASNKFGKKTDWVKDKLPGYVGEISGMAKEFLHLGPTASGAVDLVSGGLQDLLTGGFDPVSLGVKALKFGFSLFNKEEEQVNRTTEEVNAILGETATKFENVKKAIDSFSFKSDILQQHIDRIEYFKEQMKTATGQYLQDLKKWVEDRQRQLDKLTKSFQIRIEIEDGIKNLDELISEGYKTAEFFNSWQFPGVQGFTDLLQEQIDKNKSLLTSLDPLSPKYAQLSADIKIAEGLMSKMSGTTDGLTKAQAANYLGIGISGKILGNYLDVMSNITEANISILDSTEKKTAGLNNAISIYEKEMSALDSTSEEYKKYQDKILQAQYALASINGYQGDFFTWLKENDKQLNSVNMALEDSEGLTNNAGDAFHYLAEKVKLTVQEMGGFTSALVDEIDASISGLGTLAEKAITMKERYGDVQFPDMTTQLEKAIADNEALLKTLDPNSLAYKELQENIDKAKLSLALINGEVENANQYYAEQIKQVGMAGATFDEKRQKMEAYLNTIIHTEAPIKDQIQSMIDMQKNMQEGSAEYVFMTQLIEEMRAKIDESSDAIDKNTEAVKRGNQAMKERKDTADYLNDAGIKTTEGIRDQMNLYAGLASQVEKNSYEYRQLQEKIESTINSFVDSKAPLEDQVQQLIALRDTGGMGREAIEYLNQKIAEMQMKIAESNALEEMSDDLDKIAEMAETATKNIETFADYMGKQKQAILGSIGAFDELFESFKQNQDYFGGMNDPALQQNFVQWLTDATSQMHDMKEAGMENTQAYKDLSDKINLAKAAAAVMAGQFATVEEYLNANNIALYNTGDAVVTLADKLSNLGIETKESVYEQVQAYSDLAAELDANSYEYDQVLEKMDSLFKKFIDTDAPLTDQISQWQDIQTNLDTNSVAYQYVAEQIAKLQAELDGTNSEMEKQLSLTEKLSQFGIETADSVYQEIDALSKLSDELENGSYEYNQVMQKMAGLFDKLVDTDTPLQNQLYQWEDILETLDETSAAYQYVSDKISELKHEMEEANSVQAQMEKLGIKTTDSVYDEIRAYSDLADKLEKGTYEYDQVQEKLDSLFKTLIDTNAPLDDQINQWKDIMKNLDSSSAAYQYAIEQIAKLKQEMKEANSVQAQMEKLGIKTTDSVYDEIRAYSDLAKNLKKGTYEYKQVEAKMDSLFKQLIDTNAPLEDQIKQWEDIITNLDSSSEAYQYATDQIADLKDQIVVTNGQKLLDQANKDIETVTNRIEKLTDERHQLDIEFETNASRVRRDMDDLDRVMQYIGSDTPGLNTASKLLSELTGQSFKFKAAWSETSGALYERYWDADKELEEIGKSLDFVKIFGLDLSDSEIGDQINAYLVQFKQMYDQMPDAEDTIGYKTYLDLLKAFEGMGGTLDEEAASAFFGTKTEGAMSELEQQLSDLTTEYEDKKLGIDLELQGLYDHLDELMINLDDFVSKYDGTDIDLGLNLEVATAQIQDLLDRLAALGAGGGSMHVGGIAGWGSAHTGLMAANEALYKLRDREVVIPEQTAKQFDVGQWHSFIQSANPAVLGGDMPRTTIRPQFDVRVISNDPDTKVQIREKNEDWWTTRNKYKRELTTFGYN